MGIAKLSTFIRENNGPILADWEAVVRTLAQNPSVDVAMLRRRAQAMIEEVAADVEAAEAGAGQADESPRGSRGAGHGDGVAIAAADYGHDRAGNGFNLVDMIAELRALRASVTRLWVAQLPRLSPVEVDTLSRFNDAIDRAVACSLDRYVRDSDATRQQFLAILSHDLRNPLGAIDASTSFLEDVGDLDADCARLVAIIRSANQRMTMLVSDMLELALNRLGETMPVRTAPVDLGKLVDAVVTEIRASDGNAHIKVRSSGDMNGRWDPARLAQALTNVIGNAVQHGDGAEPIHVSTNGDEAKVAIEVCNSGPPIPRERIGQIFEGIRPGRRLNGDRRHLGLGLFIASKIVEGHGGSIAVHSGRARTAFTIHLPRSA